MATPSNSHNTDDGGPEAAPDFQKLSKDERRRARKRATDRNCQRQHRQRQRAYVRQLEETIQTFKTSFAQSNNSEVATLLKEQERLLARCQKLEATLLRISGLANSARGVETCPPEPAPESPCLEKASDPSVAAAIQMNKPMEETSASSGCSQTLCDPAFPSVDLDNDRPAPSAETLRMPGSILSHSLDYFDLSDCFLELPKDHPPDIHLQTQTSGTSAHIDLLTEVTSDGGNFGESNRDNSLEPGASGILDGTAMSLDVLPMSLLSFDTPMNEMVTMRDNLSSWANSSTPPGFLRVSNDLGQWDKIIISMINEARLQRRLGQFPTNEPTLRSLLSHQSTDVLASRLYHHICSFGPIPLHLLLSIFWVQYLLLRWYVLGTRSAFLRIPEFMRPTDLETRIPHRPCIGMLVWPDVRRTLIRDSNSADPERIGIELLRHLGENWVPTAHVTGELIGSTDVFAVIEHQACKLDSWKVDRMFKEKHKLFINCRLD